MPSIINEYNCGNRFVLVKREIIVSKNEIYVDEIGECLQISPEDFVSKLNDGDVLYINSYGKVKRVYESETQSIDLMLTIHCNSNCIMCPISEGARQSNEEGYFDYLVSLIDVLPANIEHICITGGEPTLLGERLFVIINKLVRKFPYAEYQMLTNGRSCGNSKLCKQMVNALPKSTLYGIPLHAGNASLYDTISQVVGSFGQVCQGIKNLVRNGAKVEIRIVVSKLNFKEMEELAEYIIANFKGIYCVTFMGIETMGNAIKNYEKIWIDYDKATESFELAIEKLIDRGIDVLIYNYPLCCLSKRYWMLSRRSITPYKVRYYKECDLCEVKSCCSGIFSSTFSVSNIKINPVVKNND